jgi:quercetin dioxygenase-like cupin family protein
MSTIYSKKNHQEVMPSPLALKCFSQENFEIILLTLKKGESIPLHKNPFEVLFFVKSGMGILTVENDEFELSENDLAMVSLTENRSWINHQDKDLELIVMKFLS